MINGDYLAFGTVYRNPQDGEKTRIGAPFKVYRVSTGYSLWSGTILKSVDRVVGVDGDKLDLDPVLPGSHQFGKVKKWVEKRRIFGVINPRCRVDQEDITKMLSK
jgi:hypothetical protein